MAQQLDDTVEQPFDPGPLELSNTIRLSLRQWVVVGVYTSILLIVAPSVWQRVEALAPGPDYRIPHDLSSDYWLFERVCRLAAERHDTLLLGDSVVWGEYVKPDETLPHYLNAQAGREYCANLGVGGAHPLALSGLVEHYAGALTGKNVMLQCNPLWLTSAETDLQEEKETDRFNHPRLVPQFTPQIPSYRAEVSARLGVLVEQHLPFASWTNHLQQAYYRTDIPGWTLDRQHAYKNPLEPLGRGLPSPDETLRHLPESWDKSGKTRQDYAWVDLERSLQWRAFRRVVATLQQRGNRVLVVVGPFNEHMLTAGSQRRYQQVKSGIEAWLHANGICHVLPPVLPSEQYGDASHPLAAGYATLARQLADHAGGVILSATNRSR